MQDDDDDDDFRDSFEVISVYSDADAIRDGVLKPFVFREIDTGHRITGNAFEELRQYYRDKGYQNYSDDQFLNFFYAELVPLVPLALKKWGRNSVLQTDYDFQVLKKWRNHDILWYEPNGIHERAITMTLPIDH